MVGVLRMGALAQGPLNRIELYRKVASGVTKTREILFIKKALIICLH